MTDVKQRMYVEVVDVSYYMAKPLPSHAIPCLPEGPCYEKAKLVPVLRVYGATPEGLKCCLHVHGVFPYFYMRCEGDPTFDDANQLVQLLSTIAKDIENALRSAQENKRANLPPSIAKLVIVKGIPFYGYHAQEMFFIKVFYYDPSKCSRLVQIVESGLVANRIFQPFEAHIPYLLQMFVDYHIEGMNYINIRDFKFRSQFDPSQTDWPYRQSNCAIESDVSCKSILNCINTAKDGCYVPALNSLWEEEKQRRKNQGLTATPEVDPSIPRNTLSSHESDSQGPLSQSNFNKRMWASLQTILHSTSTDLNTSIQSVRDDENEFSGDLDNNDFAYSQLNQDAAKDLSEELLQLLSRLQDNRQREFTKLQVQDHEDSSSDDDSDDYSDDGNEATENHHAQTIMESQADFELYSSEQEQDSTNTNSKPSKWWERDQTISEVQCSIETLGAPRVSFSLSQSEPEEDEIKPHPKVSTTFKVRKRWVYTRVPPSVLDLFPLPPQTTPQVFYSNIKDVPEKPVAYAGQSYTFPKPGIKYLTDYPNHQYSSLLNEEVYSTRIYRRRTPLRKPPTWGDLQVYDSQQHPHTPRTPRTPMSSANTPAPAPRPTHLHISNLTLLSLEIHVNTRQSLLPDPNQDEVQAIAIVVETTYQEIHSKKYYLIVVDSANLKQTKVLNGNVYNIEYVHTERALLERLVERTIEWDPDFFVGYEVQQSSFGYLIDRGGQLDPPINLIELLSRLPYIKMDSRNQEVLRDDGNIGAKHGMKKASGIWIHGRHVLNLWRCARSELKLSRYNFEEVVAHVLKRPFPKYTHATLTKWFSNGGVLRLRTLEHIALQTELNLKVMDRMQLITRTSEMARLFGIDFFSVLSRGSQYRVEAVNIRVTKRLNYIMVSPNRQQVAAQPPMECIPLVMEPLSAFYGDPVVVLDFQSLYPSMVIAYNICYSTCFGRLQNGLDPSLETVLGVVTPYQADLDGLKTSGQDTIVTPNGALFCPKHVRSGVLPLVLQEILSTRIMIKKAMKDTSDPRLTKVLDARQMALKMIANVTYGYTAASFSGRMPCAQLADAIVHCGRITLESAIKLVESHPTWHAQVVYGDTDSLFVQLRGRSLQEAWAIGQQIASQVTANNPKPVCLKLEKVYMGCFLVSKKRYVGYKFESPTQTVGILDAKGIETIRRDSCGVVQKSMRHWLKLLFKTRDVSQCKKYLQNYWKKMHEFKIPLQDFIFAKEVRLGTYAGQGPPAVLVATKAMAKDPRAEPRYAERVCYVVVRGPPGARLMDLVVQPEELVYNKQYILNIEYYITKQIIPSYERLALLTGINIRQWYQELPRFTEKASMYASSVMRIDAYYTSQHCILCGAQNSRPRYGEANWLCGACKKDTLGSYNLLQSHAITLDNQAIAIRQVCMQCMGSTTHGANWLQANAMVCMNNGCDVWNLWLRTAQLYETSEGQSDAVFKTTV
ncbi:hypothetical protein THRCLA_01100 [Thraustotheca clavata]|uniref:DNA polymerase n=1 Tax=Thraustotheca clavata TaxID=74557 RepID=A0A1W0A9K2_9STRA|nr:hypothetical protein THRCLA_01100 [Thraustotheca clavata]